MCKNNPNWKLASQLKQHFPFHKYYLILFCQFRTKSTLPICWTYDLPIILYITFFKLWITVVMFFFSYSHKQQVYLYLFHLWNYQSLGRRIYNLQRSISPAHRKFETMLQFQRDCPSSLCHCQQKQTSNCT